MYVTEVLPLAKGVRATSLTYFCPEPVSGGTLVTIPIQSRNVDGVVTKCTPAKDMKAALKQAPYEMKKVVDVGKQIFFARYITACRSFARFSGVTAGEVLRTLTPTPIVANNDTLPDISADIFLPDVSAPTPKIIQATADKQLDYINSLIQSRLTDQQSIFVCCPTTHQTEQLENNLESTATVVRLDSTLSKNALLSRWREVVTSNHPVVIVGTPPFLSVPRADLGLIIVTDEANPAYKMIARPHLDKRHFARHLATKLKRDCILTGSVLSIETIWEYRNNKIGSAFKPTFRYENGPDAELMDMRELNETKISGVKLFSPPVAKEIRQAVDHNHKLLLFVARRGRRPFTICNDCGETVTCKRCGFPLVLVDDNGSRSYVCRTCKTKQTSARRCQNCHSWRLEALGVGIDFVADVLKEKVPELNLFQIDSDATSTEKQIEEVINDFSDANGGVLLTTQLGINRLNENVDSSAVITADSLLAIPDLSAAEELFSLLMSVREHTQKRFIVQTRSQHDDIFNQAVAGDVTSFYRDQIAERKKFNYPPFSYLIKLTSSGKSATVKKNMKEVKSLFAEEKISIYPSSHDSGYTAHALLQIERDRWVDDTVLDKLHSLPLSIDINAHPRTLL